MLVHGDKLRWLAWLRVKMLTRGFRRKPATLIFTIISLLVLLFGAFWLAVGLFLVFTNFSPTGSTETLYLLFSALLLFWIALPLLSYSTNEGLDITKLQLFPLARLELMFSLIFSSLFDIWTIFLFVIFGATIAAWWTHSLALGLMTLLVILVFYMVMVGISQLILALLMRILQSRRFRDLSIILIAMFGSSCYFISRFTFGGNNLLNLGSALDHGDFSPYLQWLPSGVAASSLRAASQGNWAGSFAMLGLLVVICALALYLWQLVLARSLSASESGAARRARLAASSTPAVAYQATASATTIAAPSAFSATPATRAAVPAREVRVSSASDVEDDPLKANLLEQLQGLIKKELTCFWRDPQLKVRIFQSLIYLVLVVFLNSSGGRNSNFYAHYLPFVTAVVVFFFMLTLSLNTLGIERQSLTTLFLFPINRRRLLWGKNLAVLLMGLTALIVLLIVSTLLSHLQTMVLPAAIIGLAGMGVTLGCGNMISVYFPRYQPAMGRRGFAGAGNQAQAGGCLNNVMSLVGLAATVVLLAPVALGVGIPYFTGSPAIWLATMPLSLIYGLALYIVFTNLAARRMLATEPEILAVTTRE